MYLESDLKVAIRDTVIGGPDLLICVPLVATDKLGLLKQAQVALQYQPDLLEWRVDAFDPGIDRDGCIEVLSALRGVIGKIPLIYTVRSHLEGGLTKLSADQRQDVITAAIQTGYADIIDIELSNDDTFILNTLKAVQNSNLHMILSYHNFEGTPRPESIITILFQARNLGADIAKVAVMPQEFEDVLTLMGCAIKARKDGLQIPMIAISMGELGSLTRFAGKLFGADITFASHEAVSAPGQIPIHALRQAMDSLRQC